MLIKGSNRDPNCVVVMVVAEKRKEVLITIETAWDRLREKREAMPSLQFLRLLWLFELEEGSWDNGFSQQ